jgi:hypothetical protein
MDQAARQNRCPGLACIAVLDIPSSCPWQPQLSGTQTLLQGL